MIVYAALGDSLTAGIGAPPGMGFAPRYRTAIERKLNQPVVYENLGVSGATTGDVLTKLRSDANTRLTIAAAAVITITAGGNDLIEAAAAYGISGNARGIQKALTECMAHYTAILENIRKIKASNSPNAYLIRMIGLYNPFPRVRQASHWVGVYNRHLAGLQRGSTVFVPIAAAFVGRENQLLSPDGVHPNAKGYRAIAAQLERAGFANLGL